MLTRTCPIAVRSRPDADGRDTQSLGDLPGCLIRHGFENQGARPGCLHPLRVLEEPSNGRLRACLDFVSAQGVEGLRSEAKMPHHCDAFRGESLRQREFRPLELHDGHAAFFDEADCVLHSLSHRHLVGPEGQITDDQTVPNTP